MRTRATMTISLPHEMIQQVEEVRKTEHRTRSELIREALRTYFAVGRSYTPTRGELRAIEKGRAAFHRGEGLTLAEARVYVDRLASKTRPQARRPRTLGVRHGTSERPSAAESATGA